MSDLIAPPFTDDDAGRGGGTCELKHLDVVQLNGAVVFLTWSGEVVADAEAAVARFISAVVADRARQEPRDQRDAAIIRCIGFTDPDRAHALIARLATAFAQRRWTIAHRLVFDGSLWRELS